MRRWGRVPAPLILVLAAVAVVTIAWALLSAPWQAPDETWHFAYAQGLAERGKLPDNTRPNSFSTEMRVGAQYSRAGELPFNAPFKPPWSRAQFDRWQQVNARLPATAREDGGGPNNAAGNPPLYYAMESVPYKAAGGDVFTRLYAMRILSGLLLLVTVTATWLLAGELFGRNRLLQFVAAAVAGLQPMATFTSASVNPDALLLALFSVGFWLGVKILNDGLTLRTGVALSLVSAAAVLTKATGYVLLLAAAGVILYGLWRQRGGDLRLLARVAVVCAVAAAIPVGAWLVVARVSDRPAVNQVGSSTGQTVSITHFSPKYFASYLWQFYLPRASFMTPAPVSPEYGYDVWVRTAWAVFGWKEVRLDEGVYSALRWISVVVLLAAAVALVRRRFRLSAPAAIFLGLTGLLLVMLHHWVEFRTLVQEGTLFIQGRYFLPLLPLAACAGAAALSLLPARARAPVAGLAVAGLMGLQLLSLGAVLERYYA